MHKEVKDLITWAGKYGWSFDRYAGNDAHPILRHTSGTEYPLPATPSDYRALRNTRSALLRLAGESSDSGPAATYRKGLKRSRPRFSMDAALLDIEDREVMALCRLARIVELQCAWYELTDELSGLSPRLDRVQATKLAHELRIITEELRIIGAQTPQM